MCTMVRALITCSCRRCGGEGWGYRDGQKGQVPCDCNPNALDGVRVEEAS